jgi:uncharacterized protein (TIGR03435 family)
MRRKPNFSRFMLIVGTAIAVSVFGYASPPSGLAQSQSGSAAQQKATTAPLSFEVASIKPSQSTPGIVMIGISTSGGRFTATGVTLRMLITRAYDIRDYQISGLPGWASSDRYDINAKAENPKATSAQIKLMLQSLLAERFNLKLHRETKKLPIYNLVVGKNGPKLKKSEFQPGDAQPPNPAKPGEAGAPDIAKATGGGAATGAGGAVIAIPRNAGGDAAAGPGAPVPVKPAVVGGGSGGVAVTAGGGGPGRSMMAMKPGGFTATSVPIEFIVQRLAQILGRPVVDKTGLTGNYDVDLDYAPEQGERGMGIGGDQKPDALPAPPAGDSSKPSIFTAVQEQLGLKLNSAKGPVDLYVIDSVEKPSGN